MLHYLRAISPALVACLLLVTSARPAWSEEAVQTAGASANTPAPLAEATAIPESAPSSSPAHQVILKDAKPIEGMVTLYQQGGNLFAELQGDDYQSEYLVLISIARGIGQGDLLGGYSWSTGDDWVWQFRKIDDRVHVIRRNVRFKAEPGTPAALAVKNAYTDSILFSLPVMAIGPRGGDLVDLTPVFMSDLPQIGASLPGFMFAQDRSSWAAVKAFPDNLQLQVAATYASSGGISIESVPDSRGVTLNIHYSISRLPETGYQPRLADDRVGYFVTVVKDFSRANERDRFVRYVNRWNLQKAEPGAKLSPPKKPIVFWIEKTVPYPYRPAIRAGIEEWNKAFERIGFAGAIEVRQQPDDATWDPEDINYNTFRWITAGAGFAMGPSRMNPYTGEILDADIIFDADFIQFWSTEFETMTPQSIALLTGSRFPDAAALLAAQMSGEDIAEQFRNCRLANGMSRQLTYAAAALSARLTTEELAAAKEKLVEQALKEVTMHEVGHTLGLRHNFKASAFLKFNELKDPNVPQPLLSGSVMDYNPTNLVPSGWRQGDFYMTTLGPYDYWAIEYGYKPLDGGTDGERAELKAIAARSAEPGHEFATDEDVIFANADPDVNLFDMSDNTIEYARMQAQLVREAIPGLKDRVTKEGDDYSQTRQALNVLFARHGQSMYYAARCIGGVRTTRSHRGDMNARPPLQRVDAGCQREALALLEEFMFRADAYQIPSDLYSYLVPSRWTHWGTSFHGRKEFPIHDYVLMWQEEVLGYLLSPSTLSRMHDMELAAPAEEEVLTTAELLEQLTKSIFAEVESLGAGDYSMRKPAIASLRRNLQRVLLDQLIRMSMGAAPVPADCQTVAFAELNSLASRMDNLLSKDVTLDHYTRAHLVQSRERIRKALDAHMTLPRP